MKVPKPTKTVSGWRIYLRIGGEKITVTDTDKTRCVKKAENIKAQYRLSGIDKHEDITLKEALEQYAKDRSNALSPASIRKIDSISRNHWKDVCDIPLRKVTAQMWQRAVNAMLGKYAVKTVNVSWSMVCTILHANGMKVPYITMRQEFETEDDPEFLEPDEILKFVDAAKESAYCIPLLLALSSLRIEEIDGLDWSNVTEDLVKIRQVRLIDKDSKYQIKTGAKTQKSVRDVRIFIPELSEAIRNEENKTGKVMRCCQQTLRRACAKVCQKADVPVVKVHGLRHSFASLTAHLQMPEIVSQKIGGWSNDRVMKQIYTHVAQADLKLSEQKLLDFYSRKS